jgi:hypothetical protein
MITIIKVLQLFSIIMLNENSGFIYMLMANLVQASL